MNTLTLKNPLKSKLKRLELLNAPVRELYYSGEDLNNLGDRKFVAIVGSRKYTPYGKSQTERFSEELARAGVVIVSGMALGIDALAHRAALNSGGQTIAVLPSDLDDPYPATNRNLAEAIAKSGALISEYAESHRPHKVDFLTRNRLVAALSDAVLVTEAAARSGTLHTARLAREMGIPVFAVPGSLNSPMSAGCNYLIQQGAKLASDPSEILEFLDIDSSKQTENLIASSPQEALILDKIANGLKHSDQLIAETGLNLSELQIILTELEINGQIAQNSLGEWTIK